MEPSLSQRYHSDRHKMLEFILRSNFINHVPTPDGLVDVSNIDLDTISVDYVLDCIKSGGLVDISEATKKYYEELASPVMIYSQLRNTYFLLSDADLAGSPPQRVPPSINVNESTVHASCSSTHLDPLPSSNVASFGDDYNSKHGVEALMPLKPTQDVKVHSLGLPDLKSGLSDDDLRESAYEILLACMAFMGIEIYSDEHRRKEKSSKILPGLKSKRDTAKLEFESLQRHSELIATIRIQMQISEAMDVCIRQRLMQSGSRSMCGQIDVPQILLNLLNSIFKSDFLYERSYMQWKNRQVNVLEELLCFSVDLMASEHSTIRSSLAKIRNAKEWDNMMTPTERVEVISAIRQIALKLSSVPGQFGVLGETYYWTAGYHLNIRLYERLLFGVFDVLEEGNLIAEANDFLMLITFTWATLGITQTMHEVLYGWVIFQQFVATEEAMLLEQATLQVQKVLSSEDNDRKEELYMNSLVCSRLWNGSELQLSLMQAIFFSMSIWCDHKLRDYHLHFCQKPYNFGRVMTLASTVGLLASDECNDSKFLKLSALNEIAVRKVEAYVDGSIRAAYKRVADATDLESKAKRIHPLALLANELKLIAERELSIFCPALSHWCSEAGMISAMLLHRLYSERLKPFLEGVSCLTEDVRSVLPAAVLLDDELTSLYMSSSQGMRLDRSLDQDLEHYQIGVVSAPLILDWVISQHTHILEWTGRALDLEEWEPLSVQQRHAVSIVEVFRIIEETVDQLFGLNLPMDITHLQALLSVVFHSLNSYVLGIVNQLVEKNHLYPAAPPLTRYEETMIPLVKRKLVRTNLLDEKVNVLPISKLCIQLNTLHYVHKQLDALEDGIRKSWALVRPSISRRWTKEELPETSETDFLRTNESVDALFATTFDVLRVTTTDADIKICDFTGTRVVFSDMRDSFLFRLYHGNVEGTRLDGILPDVDAVLDHICSLIDDTLRDRLVLSVFRALLEGFAWVLLDGGPSRAFSDSDIIMIEEDLKMLKDFFVADGEGLPRFLVEDEAKVAEQILGLFFLQTENLIQMLMTASKDISTVIDPKRLGYVALDNAHILVRVLCHKKDREASKFLKRQYQLPSSSEYDDTVSNESTLRSPLMSDLLKRSGSFHWTKKGQSSFTFRSMKKKLQEATSEIRYPVW